MSSFFVRACMPVLFVCSLAPWSVHSQSASETQSAREPTLETVVVHGQRDPDGPTLSQPNLRVAKERIEQTPGGVAIVDAEEANRGRALNMGDAFRFTAGVLAQPRFGAEETRLSIRGSGLQRTFHLRGLKLMQDGVPLNQADGGGDFQSIEPLATRYIEVYRGANALQYGATTLGGAINYVSPTGYDAARAGARLEAGSYDYLRSQASSGGISGDWDYYASLSTFHQDGFRDHAVQAAQRANMNIGYRINADAETRFYFGWASSDSELPGGLSKAQLKDDPRQANAGNLAGDQQRNTDVGRIANRSVWRFGDSRLEASIYYATYDLFHPIFQVLEQDTFTVGGELRFINDATLGGRRNRLIVGYAPMRGKTEEDRFLNVSGERGARTDRSTQTASTQTVYFENSHYVLPGLALVIGLQHARVTRELDDKFGVDASYQETYRETSPKYGLLYALSPRAQLFANISKSFEPPSFSEGPVLGVPNKAQSAWTYEIGTRGETKALHWDVALYRAQLRNELLGITPNGLNAFTVNADRTIHEGVEAAAGGTWNSLSWQVAALLNRFRFNDDAVYGDNTLPGIPKLLLRAEILCRLESGVYFGPNLEWSPRKYPVDMENSFDADAYAVWGFKLGQDVDRHWSWFVDLRNLSNKKYATTTGVIRDAAGTDTAQFFPGDGRSVFLGVQWRI